MAPWNHHALEDPDPIVRLAGLVCQLRWLSEVGLDAVDVHWFKCGVSVFSATKPST